MAGISRLKLYNYRSHSFLDLAPCGRSVLISGPNGVGKTNILESISYIVNRKGIKKAKLNEIQKIKTTMPWCVYTEVKDDFFETKLSITYDNIANKKLTYVDNKMVSDSKSVNERLWVLNISPQINNIFLEAMSYRRNFFDELIIGLFPMHNQNIFKYLYYVRERQKILSMFKGSDIWLKKTENEIAKLGVVICNDRYNYFNLLNKTLKTYINGFPVGKVFFNDDFSNTLIQKYYTDRDLAIDFYKETLEKNRQADTIKQVCTNGVHRSHIEVLYEDKNMHMGYCSTGENKAMLISIILSSAYMYKNQKDGIPILLLDDVLSYLDLSKIKSFFSEIKKLGIQTWISVNESSELKDYCKDFYTLNLG